jgi:hypothetical protein
MSSLNMVTGITVQCTLYSVLYSPLPPLTHQYHTNLHGLFFCVSNPALQSLYLPHREKKDKSEGRKEGVCSRVEQLATKKNETFFPIII